jgi:hypothetical protein
MHASFNDTLNLGESKQSMTPAQLKVVKLAGPAHPQRKSQEVDVATNLCKSKQSLENTRAKAVHGN